MVVSREDRQPVWTWTELCDALNLNHVDGPDVFSVDIDSRTLETGALFIALSGKARPAFNITEDSGRDGHSYLESAFKNGATGALVHEDLDSAYPLLRCADTFDALWDLARFRRSQLDCTVVAVTGSSGKTTCKQFLHEALGIPLSQGSLNNHIGVPLTMVRTPRDVSASVIEIGTNHPGEIKPLSELAGPTIAVVLNVLSAHIGNFENQTALRREKLSIAEGLQDGGTLIVEESLLAEASEFYPDLKVSAFGTTEAATVRYSLIGRDKVNLRSQQEQITIEIPGGGEHRAATLCACAAVLDVLGISFEKLHQIKVELPPGRGRVYEIGGLTILDESYNANPDSMVKCLKHLASGEGVRKVAIVGSMHELGDESRSFHELLVPYLNEVDGIIAVGRDMTKYAQTGVAESKRWRSFATTEGLLDYCESKLEPGDVVLVKGSNTVFWTSGFVEALVQKLTLRSNST